MKQKLKIVNNLIIIQIFVFNVKITTNFISINKIMLLIVNV